MARIRTIKPDFFTSGDIVSLSPLARLFYVALWCESDRAGRFEWKLSTFKLRYLPGDNCDVQALADEIVGAGLVVLYEADGRQYAEIPTFAKHQVINNREAESTIPARVRHASSTRESGGLQERKGKERKERKSNDGGFEEFWSAWPKSERKQDKAKCAEKWAKHDLDELLPTILADLETKKRTQKWLGGFIEAPEVYLNNRRWEDGVEPDKPIDLARVTVPGPTGRDPALIKAEEDFAKAAPMPAFARELAARLTGKLNA